MRETLHWDSGPVCLLMGLSLFFPGSAHHVNGYIFIRNTRGQTLMKSWGLQMKIMRYIILNYKGLLMFIHWWH